MKLFGNCVKVDLLRFADCEFVIAGFFICVSVWLDLRLSFDFDCGWIGFLLFVEFLFVGFVWWLRVWGFAFAV